MVWTRFFGLTFVLQLLVMDCSSTLVFFHLLPGPLIFMHDSPEEMVKNTWTRVAITWNTTLGVLWKWVAKPSPFEVFHVSSIKLFREVSTSVSYLYELVRLVYGYIKCVGLVCIALL